jgi:cystathionine beta-synthase
MAKDKSHMNNVEGIFLDDITKTIGNTPLVKLRQMTKKRGIKPTILAKLEFLNPTGSVKDRMAVYLLDQAVKKGELKPGGTIVEATSGNTGAAVAMYAAANGYKAILTIPDKMSKEKIDMLRAFGAEVHICPTAVPPESSDSYYETGKRLQRETPNSYWVGQYFNIDNIEAHYRTTGPEIWEQAGDRLDILVGGIGTGGTISGTAKFLKEMNSNIEVVAVDPVGSVFYDYYKNKTMIEPQTYLVEGIGDDMLCPTLDFSVIDKIYQVTDEECFLMPLIST